MPMYRWKCDRCGGEVSILRDYALCGDPPAAEEAASVEPTDPPCEHLFRKIILAPNIAKGPNWNGAKGHWIIPLLLGVYSAWSHLF